MTHYLCQSCLTVTLDEEMIIHREPDVNWSELRCPSCGKADCVELAKGVDYLSGLVVGSMATERQRKALEQLTWIAEGQYE